MSHRNPGLLVIFFKFSDLNFKCSLINFLLLSGFKKMHGRIIREEKLINLLRRHRTETKVVQQRKQKKLVKGMPLWEDFHDLTSQVKLSLLSFWFTVCFWHSRAPIRLYSIFFFNIFCLPLDQELLRGMNHGLSTIPTPAFALLPEDPSLVALWLGMWPYCSLSCFISNHCPTSRGK